MDAKHQSTMPTIEKYFSIKRRYFIDVFWTSASSKNFGNLVPKLLTSPETYA